MIPPDEDYVKRLRNTIEEVLQAESDHKMDKVSEIIRSANLVALRKDKNLVLLEYMVTCIERGRDSGERNPLEQLHTVAEIVALYRKIRFILYRMELGLSEEEQQEGYQYLQQQEIPVYLLLLIVKREIREQEKVVLRLAVKYRQNGNYVNAVRILLYGVDWYPEADEMKIALADLYLQLQRYQDAFQILCKISKPNETIQSLIQTIERLL